MSDLRLASVGHSLKFDRTPTAKIRLNFTKIVAVEEVQKFVASTCAEILESFECAGPNRIRARSGELGGETSSQITFDNQGKIIWTTKPQHQGFVWGKYIDGSLRTAFALGSNHETSDSWTMGCYPENVLSEQSLENLHEIFFSIYWQFCKLIQQY